MSSIGVGQSVHCPRLGPGPTTNLLTQFHAMRGGETQQCAPDGHFRFASSRSAEGTPVATSGTMHLSAPLCALSSLETVWHGCRPACSWSRSMLTSHRGRHR
jgi:hypothetical protein